MGKIVYLMGKSASGKDSMYARLLSEKSLGLKPLVTYTTRPMRDHEEEGVQYHFISEEQMRTFEKEGRIIEERMYPSVIGPWYYATVDDGKTDFEGTDFLVIGTLESYLKVRDYFKERPAIHVIPVYMEVEDLTRLKRALAREEAQDSRNLEEMCRRFLADQKDFSEENLQAAGIGRRFANNENMESCFGEILGYLQGIE